MGPATSGSIDPSVWGSRLQAPSVQANLTHSGIVGLGDLVGGFMQGDAGLRAVAGDTPPLSDNHPTLQYPTEAFWPPPPVPEGLVGSPYDVLSLVAPEDRPAIAVFKPEVELHRFVSVGSLACSLLLVALRSTRGARPRSTLTFCCLKAVLDLR